MEEEHVGEGGYAKVTRRGEIAIKRIKWSNLESAIRELIFIKSCSHDCIISITSIESTPEHIKLVMKYYPSLLTTYHARGPTDVIAIMYGLVCACEYIHAMGIIHSDIKSDNCLVEEGPAPRPVLCDFGISLRIEERRHVGSVQTVTYRAPEVDFSSDMKLHTPAIDIWSVGVVMFRVISGRSMLTYIQNCEDSSVYAARFFGITTSPGAEGKTLLARSRAGRKLRLKLLYQLKSTDITAKLLTGFGMGVEAPLHMYGVIETVAMMLHPNPRVRSVAGTLGDIIEKIIKKWCPEVRQILGYRNVGKTPPSITIRATRRTIDELSCAVNVPIEVIGSCSEDCLNYAEMLYHMYVERAGVCKLEVSLACIYMASATYCDSNALRAILTVMDLEEIHKYTVMILSVL